MQLDPDIRRATCMVWLAAMNKEQREAARMIKEAVGPFDEWPLWHLEAFCSGHLKRPARFSLTCFLLANAVDPRHIVEYYLRCRNLHDEDARKDIANILKRHQFGLLDKHKSEVLLWRATEDVEPDKPKHPWEGYGLPITPNGNRRYTKFPVGTPHYARSPPYDAPWRDSIGMLNVQAPALSATQLQEVKIVPLEDPDAVPPLFCEETLDF